MSNTPYPSIPVPGSSLPSMLVTVQALRQAVTLLESNLDSLSANVSASASSSSSAAATKKNIADILAALWAELAPILDTANADYAAAYAEIQRVKDQILANSDTFQAYYKLTMTITSTLETMISGLHTSFASNSAYVVTELSALSDANSATASSISLVEANVGSLTSSVTTYATAVANINGKLSSSYGVVLDTNGYLVGFQLVNGGPTHNGIVMRADTFQLVMPGYSPQPVLGIAVVNGTPTLGFRGDIIADGSILTTGLANEAVTFFRRYADNSRYYGLNSLEWLFTFNFYVPQDANCIIFYSCAQWYPSGPQPSWLFMNVDGAQVASTGGTAIMYAPSPTMTASIWLPAGYHNVALYSNSSSSCYVDSQNVTIFGGAR